MINKRNLPIVLLILGGGVFVAFRTLGIGSNPPSKYERILHNVGEFSTSTWEISMRTRLFFSSRTSTTCGASTEVRSMTRSWASPLYSYLPPTKFIRSGWRRRRCSTRRSLRSHSTFQRRKTSIRIMTRCNIPKMRLKEERHGANS
jgi:hypothetical protein